MPTDTIIITTPDDPGYDAEALPLSEAMSILKSLNHQRLDLKDKCEEISKIETTMKAVIFERMMNDGIKEVTIGDGARCKASVEYQPKWNEYLHKKNNPDAIEDRCDLLRKAGLDGMIDNSERVSGSDLAAYMKEVYESDGSLPDVLTGKLEISAVPNISVPRRGK